MFSFCPATFIVIQHIATILLLSATVIQYLAVIQRLDTSCYSLLLC